MPSSRLGLQGYGGLAMGTADRRASRPKYVQGRFRPCANLLGSEDDTRYLTSPHV